jgi:hypothetical protein
MPKPQNTQVFTTLSDRRTGGPGSAKVEDGDAALGFVVLFLGTPSRLVDLERELQARLLPLVPAPRLLFALPDLLDDERG